MMFVRVRRPSVDANFFPFINGLLSYRGAAVFNGSALICCFRLDCAVSNRHYLLCNQIELKILLFCGCRIELNSNTFSAIKHIYFLCILHSYSPRQESTQKYERNMWRILNHSICACLSFTECRIYLSFKGLFTLPKCSYKLP